VTKVSPNGSGLSYSTYFPGNGEAIAVDSAGSAFLTGSTNTTDFQTTPGAFQGPPGPTGGGAFAATLNPSGSGLGYAAFLGDAFGSGIALDPTGSSYITGLTSAPDYPTTPGAFQPGYAGNGDAFATKLNSTASSLSYSTYLGGGGQSLTVSVRGWGVVTGPGISCTHPHRANVSSCFETYSPGTEVTLSATPSPNRTFKGWSGACIGTDPSCTVTIDAAKSVTAMFGRVRPPAPLDTAIEGGRVNQSKRVATFRFRAEGNATSFQCRLKRRHHSRAAGFHRCQSPKEYRRLKAGRYTFAVRAVGLDGTDATPAKKTFRIRAGA
jgi:uncharacterized repeat protein (TIGR02543 family)